MLAIMAHRHPAKQFVLNLRANRPLDPNRERPEISGIVDLDPAAGSDDADDHVSSSLNSLRHTLTCDRQHLAREKAGGVQHFVLPEIAERELADEVIGAGFLNHLPYLLANGTRRSRDRA